MYVYGIDHFVYQSDPLHIVYSDIWQLILQCTVWPFPAPEWTTVQTDLELMWVTSDFDPK